jgi:GDP-L-fucose synthase
MKVLVTGSNGLVGNSVVKSLQSSKKVTNLVSSNRNDTDLFSAEDTKKLIMETQPDILVNCAARVGGIFANNTHRSDFILENLKININLLEACIPNNKIKIINLGSSCIYPLNAENPISESDFMTGKLEPTNSPYAIAKITGIEIGRSLNKQFGHQVLNLMPTNLYGPNDYFSPTDSHVIPGLLARMHNSKLEKKEHFSIWGTGRPLREFMFVDDLASSIEFMLDKEWKYDLLNVGTNSEVSILELGNLIKKTIGYEGDITFDNTKPDGNPRKLLNSELIYSIGWKPSVNLEDGLKMTYKWYLENLDTTRN